MKQLQLCSYLLTCRGEKPTLKTLNAAVFIQLNYLSDIVNLQDHNDMFLNTMCWPCRFAVSVIYTADPAI